MSIYPPTGTLEIKNATLKIPVVDLQYTSNTAKLEANSNVVTEFSRSKKLIKYPRVALTSASQGGYVVTSYEGTTSGAENYNVFNGIKTGTDRWSPSGPAYTSGSWNSTQSNGTTQDVNGNNWTGEWLQIQLPNKIALKRHIIQSRSSHTHRMVRKGVILGSSTNGATWNLVDSWSGLDSESEREVSIDNIKYYDYYRLVSIELAPNSDAIRTDIQEWELYGVPEYDPEAYGTDVTVKSYPNVPNTDWLEVYYDAKGLPTGGVTTVTALGGTAISATTLGDPQVSNEAFVFDGSGDAIVSGATSLSGNPPLSYSVWFKTNSISSGTGNNSIVNIGHPASYKSLGFRIGGLGDASRAGRYRFYIFSGATNESIDTGINAELGKWTHATIVYDGLNSKLYIDGKFIVQNTNTSTNLALDTGAKVALGTYVDSNGSENTSYGNSAFDGSIANFRLFNRALTTDEIYQLYAYQKEDFGHSTNNMTLKNGRLGIGTSEPRAALDVRGDIYRNGVPAFPIPTAHFYKQSSSTTSTTHYANIRSGWVALTHAHVTVPGVIEEYSLTGANYNTDNGSSGLVVKLCKEGLYKIQFTCALSTQSGINSHIGIYIRPVYTSFIPENTGTDYIGLGDANGYAVVQGAAGSNAPHLFHRFQILRVTKAPGYAFVSMTPNSNDASHFRFENYGSTPYAVMNVMYLG